MAERKIEMRDGEIVTPVQNILKIEAGHLVMIAGGAAVPATDDSAAVVVIGIALETKEPPVSVLGHSIEVLRKKAFKLNNSATHPLSAVATTAYVEDSTTVSTDAGATNNVAVGKVLGIDSDGVWVEIN